MENNNSNKPLSAHELLNLIKLKLKEQPIEQDLDDFEKDALEGFANYSSTDKFTKLNIDVQLGISKKVANKTFFKNRTTLIFSAAASIVLIVLISLFYLIDFNKNSVSELALNNESIKEFSIHDAKNDLKKVNQDKIPIKNKKPKQKTNTDEQALFDANAKKTETLSLLETTLSTKDEASKIVNTKEEGKHSETVVGAEVSQNYSDIEKPQVASAEMSLDNNAVENDDSKVGSTKRLAENNQEKTGIRATAKKINNQVTDTPFKTEPKASFSGVEVEMKNYVIAYDKKSNLDTKLKGSYKVNVVIKPDGSIRVLKIKSIANGDLKSINRIKKILNSMKKLNVNKAKGKSVQSNKEIVLEF
jgi:hypothetical protein